jgi:tRNA (mo5U34)-methyltransferase
MINAPLERINLHLGKQSSRAEFLANEGRLRGEIQRLQAENCYFRAELARIAPSVRPPPKAATFGAAGVAQNPSIHASALANARHSVCVEPQYDDATSRVPAPPAGLDKETLFGGIYWHQRWQVFRGVYTPGHNPVEKMCEALQVPGDLTGKRVLDIGAWNGCLTFECERRGASEVVAVEPADPNDTGFHRLADILGSRRSRCLRGTIYDLDPEKLGHFDVVFCCGVLYHLRYPLLGLDNIRRVCTGDLYLETLLSDDALQARYSAPVASAPLWEFYRLNEVNDDYSNWFGPTTTAVVQALESAGFAVALAQSAAGAGRGVFKAHVKEGVPEFLAIQSGEGFYYDLLVSHLLGKQKPGAGESSAGRMAG